MTTEKMGVHKPADTDHADASLLVAQHALASAWAKWKNKKIKAGMHCPAPKILTTSAGPLSAARFGKLFILQDVLDTGDETLITWLTTYNAALLANPWLKRQRYLAVVSFFFSIFCLILSMFWLMAGSLIMMVLLTLTGVLSADQYAVNAINARQSIAGLKAERRFRGKKLSYFDAKRILIMRNEF